MRWCTVLVPAAVLALLPATAVAQSGSGSALVVDIPADDLYHEPGCPLVAKAGSKVSVMRQAEAARRGLKPHDCDAHDPEQDKAAELNASQVLVQEKDTRYHKPGCARLKAGARTLSLDEAGQKYWPCPVCKPPIRKKTK